MEMIEIKTDILNVFFQKVFSLEENWKRWRLENFGYKAFTTFYSDFLIAEHVESHKAKENVLDTFNRSFNGWKSDIKYMAELYMVLCDRCNILFDNNEELALVYQECSDKVYTYIYAQNDDGTFNYSKLDINYFFELTD